MQNRGLTSVKRVKAVLWCCRAREELATMPIDTDIDFLSGACSASLTREDGGPERGNRAVWEGLRRRARTRSGWINGWKLMFYRGTFFVL